MATLLIPLINWPESITPFVGGSREHVVILYICNISQEKELMPEFMYKVMNHKILNNVFTFP